MRKYEVRVLQPDNATLALDLARFLETAMTGEGHCRLRTYPSRKYAAHRLVYIDLIHNVQKGTRP